MVRLEEAHGAAVHREMRPFVQYGLLGGVNTLLGLTSMHALPCWLYSDEALLPLVGCNAQPVRQGICQRGASKRQGERASGPLGPAPLAKPIVKWTLRDLEAVFKRAMRVLAEAGGFGKQGMGMAAGTALETTAR